MALTNIGIYKNWIVYQASDGVIELWRGKGKVVTHDKFVQNKSGMDRVITTATNYAEAMEWIDKMTAGKGRKKVEQNKNSRSVDLSEYDKNQTNLL